MGYDQLNDPSTLEMIKRYFHINNPIIFQDELLYKLNIKSIITYNVSLTLFNNDWGRSYLAII